MSCTSVVQIVQLSTGPSGDFQVSHSPANAICSAGLQADEMRLLVRLAPFVEAVGNTRQRRFLNAERNAGLVSTVSTRALMHELPILASLAQLGIRPHLALKNSRSSPSRMNRTFCVGAMLYAGAPIVIERSGDGKDLGKEPRIGE